MPSPAIAERAGTVVISSTPDGAEIFVDEKFHGNAPATLRLSTGSHAIVLKFPGRGLETNARSSEVEQSHIAGYARSRLLSWLVASIALARNYT